MYCFLKYFFTSKEHWQLEIIKNVFCVIISWMLKLAQTPLLHYQHMEIDLQEVNSLT